MFQGEKTSLFWIGLLILSFASVALFAVVFSLLSYSYSPYDHDIPFYIITSDVPIIVAAIVFMLVGLYMMKSGVKKTPSPQQTQVA